MIKNIALRRLSQRYHLNKKRSKVFLVHGRDIKKSEWMRACLERLDLLVLRWEDAIRLTGSGSPYTLDIVRAGMRHADICVILFTPDEEVRLIDELSDDTYLSAGRQARPNVWIEAGMAIANDDKRVIMVETSGCRTASDLHGITFLRYHDGMDKMEFLNLLQNRLSSCGCRTKIVV